MTWFLIVATLAVGFGEYCCAHALIRRLLRVTENKAHVALVMMISIVILFPMELIWKAFTITLFSTPLVLWVGFSMGRFRR